MNIDETFKNIGIDLDYIKTFNMTDLKNKLNIQVLNFIGGQVIGFQLIED